MYIEIANYLVASHRLQQQGAETDALVILDPQTAVTRFVPENSRRHRYLRFHDVDHETADKRAPTATDIEEALAFAAGAENLLVSCKAGQSRSAALATVIAHRHNGGQQAMALLNAQRHIPNALIIELGAKVLGDATLLENFRQWQETHRHIRFVDHLPEIAAEMDALEEQGVRNQIELTLGE